MIDSVSDMARTESGPKPASMNHSGYLQPERVVVGLCVSGRKRLFEKFAELITKSTSFSDLGNSENDQNPETIFEILHHRERLGSTALGKGIALPHGRIDGLSEPVVAIAKLEEPIEYDSPDGLPVWIAVCLLVPTEANETHLNLLAALATKFSDEKFVREVKDTRSATELYKLFSVV